MTNGGSHVNLCAGCGRPIVDQYLLKVRRPKVVTCFSRELFSQFYKPHSWWYGSFGLMMIRTLFFLFVKPLKMAQTMIGMSICAPKVVRQCQLDMGWKLFKCSFQQSPKSQSLNVFQSRAIQFPSATTRKRLLYSPKFYGLRIRPFTWNFFVFQSHIQIPRIIYQKTF